MFKVNNKDTRTTSVTSSGVFIVNFEHISRLALVFLLNADWEVLLDYPQEKLRKLRTILGHHAPKGYIFTKLAVQKMFRKGTVLKISNNLRKKLPNLVKTETNMNGVFEIVWNMPTFFP